MWFCYPRGATEGNLGGGGKGRRGGREERRGEEGGQFSIQAIIEISISAGNKEIKESKKLAVAANQMQD